MVPVLFCISIAAAPVPLRVLFQGRPAVQPSKGHTECEKVDEEGCGGGFPDLRAAMQQASEGAEAVVRILGADVGTLMDFHPLGIQLNNDVWQRLGAHVGVLSDLAVFSQIVRRDDVKRWLGNRTAPVVLSNMPWDEDPESAMFSYLYRDVQTDLLHIAGRWKVGVIAFHGAQHYLTGLMRNPRAFIPWVATRLREYGAHVVVAIAIGLAVYHRDAHYQEWAELGVDVVVPPECANEEESLSGLSVGLSCFMDKPMLYRGTWFLPPTDNSFYSNLTWSPGRALQVIDFKLDGKGGLVPSATHAVDLVQTARQLRRLPVAPAVRADWQWTQKQIDLANDNDPEVGVSLGWLPSGRITANNEPGRVLDEVCRRDYCPIGDLTAAAVEANMAAMPEGLNADIVIINGGALRYGWPQGRIRLSQIYELTPFKNSICSFLTTGSSVWRNVRHFLGGATSTGTYNASFSGRGGFPQARGLRFEFDPSRDPADRLVMLEVFDRQKGEWNPISRARHYRIVTTLFVCSGGDGYSWNPYLGAEQYDVVLQDMLRSYIKNNTPIEMPGNRSLHSFGDPRPAVWLANQTLEDCLPQQYFSETWAACFDCPTGEVRDPIHSDRCRESAAPGEDLVWLWVLLGVLGVVALATPPVASKYYRQWRRNQRLYSAHVMAQSCAESIAMMEFDKVKYIEEIEYPSKLQQAFIDIIGMLRCYRTFMPDAIFATDPEGDHWPGQDTEQEEASNPLVVPDCISGSRGEPVCPVDSGCRLTVKPAPDRRLSLTRTLSAPRRSSAASSGSSVSSLNETGCPRQWTLLFGMLQPKRVAVMWSGVSSLHDRVGADGAFIDAHAAIVECVLAETAAHKGVPDQMSGDRVMSTFGACRFTPDQRLSAVLCTLAVGEKLSRLTPAGGQAGAEAGIAHVGFLGTAAMRRHTVLGGAVNVAYMASRCASLHAVPAVAGEKIFAETYTAVAYWALTVWAGRKLGGFTMLYEILHEKITCRQSAASEWMYELQQHEDEDAHGDINAHLRSLAMQARKEIPAPLGREELVRLLSEPDAAIPGTVPLDAAF